MGLVITHDAYEGSFEAFNLFRKELLAAIGGKYLPKLSVNTTVKNWFFSKDSVFSDETHKGLVEFFNHSDSDGAITPEMCKVIADELENILPLIQKYESTQASKNQQIISRGGYVQMTIDFIKGCRLAHSNNESLDFL